MRRIFMSFLGLGRKGADGKYAYAPVVYELKGETSTPTTFVQVAELALLGAEQFDEIAIFDTAASHRANYADLRAALVELGARNVQAVTLAEEMSAAGQWAWFEAILGRVQHHDSLTVDLTHGYRAAPIVFSAALNFLQKARAIQLEAVYYGVYEKQKELGYAPIIDMGGFYAINEWADGVSRLVEDADAGKLARVAGRTPSFQFGELGDPELISEFTTLTDTIKNVNANDVCSAARGALERVHALRSTASPPAALLLELVASKFSDLAHADVGSRYDGPYFKVQVALARLLLEHRLFMQAYTVMRECLASLGMIGFEREGMNAQKRKKRRQQHAEVFIRFFQIEERKWRFPPGSMPIVERMQLFYDEFKAHGVEKKLRAIARDLGDYRNGFDHAWMGKPYKGDIEEKAYHFLEGLEKILEQLEKKGLMP
jgi:CRISPR-associated Csx2 family protein